MKQLKMLLLTGMLTLFTTFTHANTVNMVPIISYLLSDTGGGSSTSNVNTTLKGSFNGAYTFDTYTFTAQSTGAVWFAWSEDVQVELWEGTDPDTLSLVGYDTDGIESMSIIEGQAYTVRVWNINSLNIEEYNVNVVTTNDNRGEAVALVPNKSYTDTLNENNNILRVYNFVANSTGVATVKTNWYGDTAYAYTYVYENGVYQGYDLGNDNTALSFNTVEGRTYSIVQRFSDTDYLNLDYNIEVITPNDTRGDAVSVIPNTPYIKTLNQNKDSMDVYNFTASSNGTGYARATWRGDTNYAYMYVYENGVYVGYDLGNSAVDYSFDVIEGRNYTVRMSFTDTDNLDIDYGFEVATTNDLRGNAVTLSPNSHYNATMHENESFFDVYNFTATSTGAARALASWYGTTNYGYMYLYENGVYQAYDLGNDYNELSFYTVEGRTYTLIFLATDTDGLEDSYSFNFATTDQANATIATLGEEYTAILNENTNTYATYSFTPTTDMSATALASWVGTTNYGYMYLYENGVYQAYDLGSSSFGVTYAFRAGRTYTMIVTATDTDNLDEDITFSIN